MSTDSFKEKGILIDVRSKDEWDEGHIEGAVLIPCSEIESRIGDYVQDKKEPINIYCASGIRASIAKSTLASMGYTNVSNLGEISTAQSKIASK